MKRIFAVFVLCLICACSKIEQPQEVWIKNAQNEKLYLQIDGWQNAANHKLAFLQHGLASNMEHVAIQTAKKVFLDNGYIVVLFDSRYSLGQSDGKVQNVRLSTFEDDLETVIDWAKQQNFYSEPFALAGHSLGGASVLLYAEHHPELVNTLIPIVPVVSGQLWEDGCMKNMPDFCNNWRKDGFYNYKNNVKEAIIPYLVVEDAKSYNALTFTTPFKVQTLLVASEHDKIISPHDIQDLAEYLNVKTVIIPQSGHNFETKQNVDDLYQALRHFIQ